MRSHFADKREELVTQAAQKSRGSTDGTEVQELQRQVKERRDYLSPLRNRASSAMAQISPSRTNTLMVSYGSEEFKQRYARRRDNNLPLPIDDLYQRTFSDSQLLRQRRDFPEVDERRVTRMPSLLPASDDRQEGLNGEEGSAHLPAHKRCSDVTKFNSTSIDPHAVTQANVRSGCHRVIKVYTSFNGMDVKSQVRRRDKERAARLVGKPAAGRPTDEHECSGLGDASPAKPISKNLAQTKLGPAAGCFGWQLGGRMSADRFQDVKAACRDEKGQYIL